MRLAPATPVLARPDGAIQVGLGRPVVLSSLSVPQSRFVQSLEGGRTVRAPEKRRYRTVLAELADRGHVVTTPRDSRHRDRIVRFLGASAVSADAASVLARAGVPVSFVDDSAAWPDRRWPARSTRAAAASALVAARVPTARLRSPDAHATLDVLVSVGPALSRARPLMRFDQPHLLVECDEAGVTVGPLVVPGRGACATCLALHRADRDTAWPMLALQCEARHPHLDPATVAIAAGCIAQAALAFLEGHTPQTVRVEAPRVAPLDAVAPHPDCACTAAGPRTAT